MAIFRTETDISTGEVLVINQSAYEDVNGNVIVLDDGVLPPAGYAKTDVLPDQKPLVPDRVTMRQARLALLGAGLLDDVEAALAALEGAAGQAARIEWEYSQEVWRNKPFVQQVAGAIGMSDEQIDQMFITAAGIQ